MALLVVETMARLRLLSPLMVPAPSTVFSFLIKDTFSGDLLKHSATSLGLLVFGLVFAIGLALVLAFVGNHIRLIDDLMDGLCALLSPIPSAAVLPLMIIWFGIGTQASLAVLVHAVLWPYYQTIRQGMKNQPKIYNQVAEAYGIKGLMKFIHIDLFAILATALDGLRGAWGRAWRALITTEMIFGAIGKSGGIGWYILKSRVFMDTPRLYTGILVVVLIGLLTERVVFDQLASHTLVKWGLMEGYHD